MHEGIHLHVLRVTLDDDPRSTGVEIIDRRDSFCGVKRSRQGCPGRIAGRRCRWIIHLARAGRTDGRQHKRRRNSSSTYTSCSRRARDGCCLQAAPARTGTGGTVRHRTPLSKIKQRLLGRGISLPRHSTGTSYLK